MIKKLIRKMGYISLSEAEEYDYTLLYSIGDTTYNRKIIDYFQDDGLAFRDRYSGRFTLDETGAKDIRILKYNGHEVYSCQGVSVRTKEVKEFNKGFEVKKIIKYIGQTCSGKTTALLKDIEYHQEELNQSKTLVVCFESEENKFKELLPDAKFILATPPYIKKISIAQESYNNLIVDELSLLDNFIVDDEKSNLFFYTAQRD